MNKTLSQLIDSELGIEDGTPSVAADTGTVPVREQAFQGETLADEAEKVASVLEYLVDGGLEKVASAYQLPAGEVGSMAGDNDAGRKVPRHGTGINTLRMQRGTSHPALASAEAAAAAGPSDVSRQNAPALGAALDHTPYDDGFTPQVLGGKVDHKDINARLKAAKAAKARRQGA